MIEIEHINHFPVVQFMTDTGRYIRVGPGEWLERKGSVEIAAELEAAYQEITEEEPDILGFDE